MEPNLEDASGKTPDAIAPILEDVSGMSSDATAPILQDVSGTTPDASGTTKDGSETTPKSSGMTQNPLGKNSADELAQNLASLEIAATLEDAVKEVGNPASTEPHGACGGAEAGSSEQSRGPIGSRMSALVKTIRLPVQFGFTPDPELEKDIKGLYDMGDVGLALINKGILNEYLPLFGKYEGVGVMISVNSNLPQLDIEFDDPNKPPVWEIQRPVYVSATIDGREPFPDYHLKLYEDKRPQNQAEGPCGGAGIESVDVSTQGGPGEEIGELIQSYEGAFGRYPNEIYEFRSRRPGSEEEEVFHLTFHLDCDKTVMTGEVIRLKGVFDFPLLRYRHVLVERGFGEDGGSSSGGDQMQDIQDWEQKPQEDGGLGEEQTASEESSEQDLGNDDVSKFDEQKPEGSSQQ